MKNKKKKGRPEPSPTRALLAALRGMLVFLIAAPITALPAAIIAYATDDPVSCVLPCGLAVLYLSALAAGFASYKFNGGLALLTGTYCGGACIAAALLLALSMPSTGSSATELFLTRLPVLFCSVIGAYLGSAKRQKRRKRK